MQKLPVLLLSILAVLLLQVSTVHSASTLQKVTLLTRNGARGLSNIVDGKVTCENCEISSTGKEMSLKLGKFLSSRYREQLTLGDRFNPTLVSFYAAQTERTIVTGEGITLGIYPSALPLVNYNPEQDDKKLSFSKSWPSFILRNVWKEKLHTDDAWALEKLGENNINTLSQFIPANNDGLCKDSPSLCAFYIYDSWCVNASEGRKDPTLKPLLNSLEIVSKRFAWRLYGLDSTNEIDVEIGPLAGPFLRNMITEFASDKNKVKLSINIGLMPIVFATLSNLGVFDEKNTLTESSPNMPQFADSIAFEYSTNEDKTQQYIQVYHFTQISGSTDNYISIPLVIKCINSNGNIYFSNTTIDGCPVTDMLRYLESLGSPNGECNVSDTTLSEIGCDSESAPDINSLCYIYRSKCPGAPCGAVHGAIADPSRNFMCQDRQLNKDAPYLIATIVAIGAPCVLAGAIVGFYLFDRIRRLIGFGRKPSEEQ